jgi:hypothetical protein
MKQKTDKEGRWRLVLEGVEENLAAPIMELSDGFMEQMEAMVKELRKIGGGIWALVKGVGKLMEIMEQLERMEMSKVEKEVEIENVQRVNKGTVTEIMSEEGSEEDSEGEKEEDKEGNRDKEMDGDEEN